MSSTLFEQFQVFCKERDQKLVDALQRAERAEAALTKAVKEAAADEAFWQAQYDARCCELDKLKQRHQALEADFHHVVQTGFEMSERLSSYKRLADDLKKP